MTEPVQQSLQLVLTVQDWFSLFLHYLSLSLLAIGGAITTAPDMHRYLVDQQRWLTDAQFNASIAIAQAAPGPNVLFIALMGWNVGLNAGGMLTGLLGVFTAMLGILIPSTTLTYLAAQWGHRNRELRAVRAFKQGMAPIVVALLVATGWILATTNTSNLAGAHLNGGNLDGSQGDWRLWLLTAVTAIVVWRSKLHMLWLLGAGAALGALGWV